MEHSEILTLFYTMFYNALILYVEIHFLIILLYVVKSLF